MWAFSKAKGKSPGRDGISVEMMWRWSGDFKGCVGAFV